MTQMEGGDWGGGGGGSRQHGMWQAVDIIILSYNENIN